MSQLNRSERWFSLVSTAPALPGGKETQVEAMRTLLLDISSGRYEGLSESRRPLHYQVTGIGLAESVDGQLRLTPWAEEWVKSGDAIALMDYLHAHLRFFGEILEVLRSRPLRPEDVLEAGRDQYLIDWSSMDQVRRRLMWLECAGLIEARGDRYSAITESGLRFVDTHEMAIPAEIRAGSEREDVSLEPIPEGLESLIAAGRARRLAISYLTADPVRAMNIIAQSCLDGLPKSRVIKLLRAEFTISDSSALMVFNGARHSGLIQYTGREVVTTTELGREWIDNASALNFALLMHATYQNVLEVLLELDEHERRDTREVHAKLTWSTTSPPKVQRTTGVLRWLVDAGLVREAGYLNFLRTPLGRAVLEHFSIRPAVDTTTAVEAAAVMAGEPEGVAQGTVDRLVAELLESSVDSSKPERFERSCTEAFNFLGGKAEHLGGPGNPDVVIDVVSGFEHVGRATVDAKSSAGPLSEKAVNFDAIKEHARKKNASRTAIISPAFGEDSRLVGWAKDHGIVMLTAQELAAVVQEHAQFPLSSADLWDFFAIERDAGIAAARAESVGFVDVVQRVVAELLKESEQDAAEPISARDMYRSWRSEADAPPEAAAKEALEFLAQPHIEVVERRPHGTYVLRDQPRVAAGRLRALTKAIADVC